MSNPAERISNNGQTTVAEQFISGSTSLVVTSVTTLPALTGSDCFHVIVYTPPTPSNPNPTNNAEIMRVTAMSGTTLTVVPAVEPIAGDQTSYYHPPGDVVANSLTVESITNLVTQIAQSMSGPRFSWWELPSGSINGSNNTFTIANAPTNNSLALYLNGVVLKEGAGNDYTLSGTTITFVPGMTPQSGDALMATYTY